MSCLIPSGQEREVSQMATQPFSLRYSPIGSKIRKIAEQNAKLQFDQFLKQNYANFQEVKVFTAGSAFGEIALLTGQQRTATMVCKDNVICALISRKAFDSVMENYKVNIIKNQVTFLRNFGFLDCLQDSKLISMWQFLCK